jgi:hypothetical protein
VVYGLVVGWSALTRRAGVRVPSTSKRQIVFFTGRSASEGITLAAGAVVVAMVYVFKLLLWYFVLSVYVYGSELLKYISRGDMSAQTA